MIKTYPFFTYLNTCITLLVKNISHVFLFFGSCAYRNITSIMIPKSQIKTVCPAVVEGKSLKKNFLLALNSRKVTDLSKRIWLIPFFRYILSRLKRTQYWGSSISVVLKKGTCLEINSIGLKIRHQSVTVLFWVACLHGKETKIVSPLLTWMDKAFKKKDCGREERKIQHCWFLSF